MPRHLIFRAAVPAIAALLLATSPKPSAAQQAQALDPVATAADQGRILGSEKAALWILIVSDFQCPFCRTWHGETWEQLRKEYVATGKVRVAYVHFPLGQHPNARPTAIASMCAAAQGKFWPMADRIFRSQDKWKDLKDPAPFLDSLARAEGLDAVRQRACTASPAVAALVEADRVRMTRAGAGSTPTFFIGSKRLEGAQPIAAFRRVIEAELLAGRSR